MRMRLLAALLALGFAATLRATVIVPADLNELTIAAHAVVYARVVEVRALESADRLRVETLVTAEAVGYMKGNLGRTIVFRVPGGTVGAYRTMMVGAPSFEVGDEVVLFFATRPPALPYLVGFSQGVYRVRVDEATNTRLVVPPPAFATGETVKLTRGTRVPMPLDQFAAEIRQIVSGEPRSVR